MLTLVEVKQATDGWGTSIVTSDEGQGPSRAHTAAAVKNVKKCESLRHVLSTLQVCRRLMLCRSIHVSTCRPQKAATSFCCRNHLYCATLAISHNRSRRNHFCVPWRNTFLQACAVCPCKRAERFGALDHCCCFQTLSVLAASRPTGSAAAAAGLTVSQ